MPTGIPNKKKTVEPEAKRDPHTLGLQRETEGRSPRVSMSAGGKLAIPDEWKEEGYMYYLAVDHPGELAKFEAAWWEYATDPGGNRITRPAGNGRTHYLMRLPQDLYDKDMAEQQGRVNDALIKSAKVDESEGQYVPKDREGVLTRDVIV